MGRKRIGILGGTFDPPHIGHLLLAETAREQLGLEKVLFLPAGEPPHKRSSSITAARHRRQMTLLAIRDNAQFVLDATDLDRPPPHYTASLLPILGQIYPDRELWLLIGSDSLRDFLTWYQPAQILRLCRLAVLPRPGAEADLATLSSALPELASAVSWLDGPAVALSATQIRRWSLAGRSLRYLVPEAILDYMAIHGLYGWTQPLSFSSSDASSRSA